MKINTRKTATFIFVFLLICIFTMNSAKAFFFNPKPPKRGGSVFGRVTGPSGIKNAPYQPVKGVEVTIKGTKFTALTDDKGGFQFEKVPAGKYSVIFKKAGYSIIIKQIEVKEAGQVFLKDVTLRSSTGVLLPKDVIPPDTVYVGLAISEKYADKSPSELTKLTELNRIHWGGVDEIETYDGGNKTLFPVSGHSNSLMIVNNEDREKTNYQPLKVSPLWLRFNKSGTKLYAATRNSGIAIYHVIRNHARTGLINVNASDLILSPDGKRLYAAGLNGMLYFIHTDKDEVVDALDTTNMTDSGETLRSLASSPDGKTLYLLFSSADSGQVISIDPYTKQVTAKAPAGSFAIGIAVSPDGKKIYVTNMAQANVSVLTANPLQLKTNVRAGLTPIKVIFTPDGRKAYVTCRGDNTTAVINAVNDKYVSSIDTGAAPLGIAITSDGKRVYVANNEDRTLSIIDTETDSVIFTTPPQGISEPWGIVVKP